MVSDVNLHPYIKVDGLINAPDDDSVCIAPKGAKDDADALRLADAEGDLVEGTMALHSGKEVDLKLYG